MKNAFCLILLAAMPSVAADPDDARLAGPPVHELPVEVTAIELATVWEGDSEDASTDLIQWKGEFYCAVGPIGESASSEGRIVVLSSPTGDNWRKRATLALDGMRLSKPDLTVAPDGRLMLSGEVTARIADGPKASPRGFISVSSDGSAWSEPRLSAEPEPRPGRITWHGKTAYGFGRSAGGEGVDLFAGDDALSWRVHAAGVATNGDPTEAQLRFDSNGTAYALLCRKAAGALLLKSRGDFTRWSTYNLDRSCQWARPFPGGTAFRDFSGPNFVETFPGIWIAVGRMDEGGFQSSLTWLDVDAGDMRWLARLPGSAGTGAHGMAWHGTAGQGGTLYISYCATIEGKMRVRIAKVTLRRVPHHFTPVCKDAGAGSYEAFPDVCRLKDGRLLCVFYAGLGHVNHPSKLYPLGGRIAGCVSGDEGRTWSEPVVIVDGPMDDRDPSVAQLSDGRLLCVYFRYPKGGVRLVESNDAGKTWSPPRQIAPGDYYVSSPIRELSGGRLILGLYRTASGTANGAVVFSDDRGKTWENPVQIDNAGVRLDAETDLVELDDGSLYALQRAGTGTPAYWSRSEDRGVTWTRSEPVGFQAQAPYLHKMPCGTILLGYRMLGKQGTIGNAVRASTDGCRTWGVPVLVDRGGGYTSMVDLKDGSVLYVYYSDRGIGPARSNGRGGQQAQRASDIRARRLRVVEGKIRLEP